jgi:hypothetical protein
LAAPEGVSVMGYQLSAISYQLSAIGYRLFVVLAD